MYWESFGLSYDVLTDLRLFNRTYEELEEIEDIALRIIKTVESLEGCIIGGYASNEYNYIKINIMERKSQQIYEEILSKADKVTLVSDKEYEPSVMQKRNEFMVDNSDLVVAVWNGTSGGTANCLAYMILKDNNRISLNIPDIERS